MAKASPDIYVLLDALYNFLPQFIKRPILRYSLQHKLAIIVHAEKKCIA